MQVKFIDADGVERFVEGKLGESAMRCATRHLIAGIVGECGGAMACGTCHVYVVEGATLPAPSAQELAMLEGCIDVQPDSRLSCQLLLHADLDGLGIEVPKSQT